MTTYFDRQGALHQFEQGGWDCRDCSLVPDYEGCKRSQKVQDCNEPSGTWSLVQTLDSTKQCDNCAHVGKASDQEPCNQCVFNKDVPVGYRPKWEALGGQSWTPAPVVVHEAPKVIHKPEVVSDPKDFGPNKTMFFHSEVTAHELGAKPTNPKDLIGVRKVPMSTVPAGVLMDVALALHEGAVKYGRHNYRGVGVRGSVYYDAAVGHLMDWWEGDDIDAESGLSHVTKAIASLVVLRDAMLQDKLTDDRPPRSRVFKRDFNQLAGEIIDRHADKSPRHWTIADTVQKARSE